MPLLVKYICEGKLDSEVRLSAALDFLTRMPPNKTVADVDTGLFDEACGVGVVVTPAQIEDAVEEELNKVQMLQIFYERNKCSPFLILQYKTLKNFL